MLVLVEILGFDTRKKLAESEKERGKSNLPVIFIAQEDSRIHTKCTRLNDEHQCLSRVTGRPDNLTRSIAILYAIKVQDKRYSDIRLMIL